MIFVRIAILCLVVGLTACSSVETMPLDEQGELLLVVIDDPRPPARREGNQTPGYNIHLNYAADPILDRYAKRIAKDYDLTLIKQWPLRTLGVHCFIVAKPSSKVESALLADSRIKWIQDFNEFSTKTGTPGSTDVASLFRNSFDETGKNITIAVIDTGADQTHLGLQDARFSQVNFVSSDLSFVDEPHGTAVIGVIAARDKPGANSVKGIAQDADVKLLRACWQMGPDSGGRCNTFTLALALEAAILLAPDIVNLSLTGPEDRVLTSLINKLVQGGTLVIAAYDEQRPTDARFPRANEGVVFAYGLESGYRQHVTGEQVLFAPRHALSLAPGNAIRLASGHSIAAPHLTGMAACLMERHPKASRQQIVARLEDWLDTYYLN